ncbi:MAG: xanthine dehydrogenase family protein [Candidatus Rokubacteria bacterium]|nr:xanthine dehydrogenase family protein [Candidatus Rokubacteria bacterium]
MSLIGEPLRRQEDPRLLRGKGAYVADVQRPGTRHMAVLRSPHAHARIAARDFEDARRSPGVVAILAAEDVSALTPLPVFIQPPGSRQTSFPILPAAKAIYVGQPVAAVVAESRYVAEDALERMHVTYEPLPAVTDVDDAVTATAPRLHDGWPDNVAARREILTGDPDRAFAGAHTIVEGTFTMPRHAAAPLEGRAALASFDRDTGELTVWASSQAPHLYRTVLAATLGMEENRIVVIVPDVGGGFGVKLHYYPEDVLVAVAAMRLHRPVTWIETRSENLAGTVHARQQRVRARAAFDAGGTLLALESHVRGDVGAHLHTKGPAPIFTTGVLMPGPYDVRHYRARIEAVVTNKTPFGAYRAFGQQQGTFVMERLMDMAARTLGLDPADIRRRNFIPAPAFPYRSAGGWEFDSGRYADGLARALDVARYGELRAWQARERDRGRLIGIGLACYVEFTGMGPSKIMAAMGNRQGGYETAVVRIDPTGHATITSGIIEIGQGIRSSMAQIAADVLGLPYEKVRVVLGHTALTPYSAYGTAGSRGAVVAGGSVREASRLVKHKATKIAAHLLEAAEADIEVVQGRYRVRGAPSAGLTLADIAQEAHRGQRLPEGTEPGLEARYVHEPKNWTFSSGVHVAAVEVDPDTGAVRIAGYWIAHDCGKVINPMLVDGQLHGGVAQGVGAALMEDLVYDDEGQLLTRTFMDYAVPTATYMPEPGLEHLETLSPHTPGGVKGMSEGGTVAPPAAIANAVADALAGRGVDAGAVDRYPLTAPRVFGLLRGDEHVR